MPLGQNVYGTQPYGGEAFPSIIVIDTAVEEEYGILVLESVGDVPLPAVEEELESPVLDPRFILGSDVTMLGFTVDIYVVDKFGNRLAQLPNAKVNSISDVLNSPDTASISVDPLDPGVRNLSLVNKEVQIWIDGDLKFWGQPWRVNGNFREITFELEDPMGSFRKRIIDRTSLIYTSIEQRDIAWELLNYAQQDTMDGQTNRDLNITKGEWSGVSRLRSRQYLREEHPKIYQLLEEFPLLDGGFDWDLVYNLDAAVSYEEEVLKRNPIGYWILSDSDDTDTALDSSGQGRHGVIMGDPLRVSGMLQDDPYGALHFTGVDEYVDIEDDVWFDGGAFTVAAWVQLHSYVDYQRLIEFGAGQDNSNVVLFLSADAANSRKVGAFQFNGAVQSSIVYAPSSLNLDTIYFLVFAYDGNGNLKIYKDGVLWATLAFGDPDNVLRTTNYIGKSEWGHIGLTQGIIQHVAIFSEELSDSVVQRLYDTGQGTFDTRVERQWQPYHPRKGIARIREKLIWKADEEGKEDLRNILSFSWSEDAVGMATEVYALGGTSSEGIRFEGIHENVSKSAEYGVLQEVWSEGDTLDTTWLTDRAKREVLDREEPAVAVSITGAQGVDPDLASTIDVGDWLPIVIDHGRIQVDAYYRVSTKIWRPDNTFDLEFDPEYRTELDWYDYRDHSWQSLENKAWSDL